MNSINADLDRMNDFLRDIKRHKEDIISKQNMITFKLTTLGDYWKDKAYEKFKNDFLSENNLKTKQLMELYDLKIQELGKKILELETYLEKLNRP